MIKTMDNNFAEGANASSNTSFVSHELGSLRDDLRNATQSLERSMNISEGLRVYINRLFNRLK